MLTGFGKNNSPADQAIKVLLEDYSKVAKWKKVKQNLRGENWLSEQLRRRDHYIGKR